ncbi:dephospho-CoA kinase [uncultured Muriicola sp.]|uniref:dephospho-CoA kinase n=1 Tax=uncultured Muriicola sp. TaxID=1583102 RepID=UPI00260B8E7B|nr:dephospho-CoA kinase [uncultured Muriicola sp.]
MIRIGLTGGIGSGKTTVAAMFEDLGVAVYNSDIEAKRLMNEDPGIRTAIRTLFGEMAYQNNALNRKFLAEKAFKNRELLIALNEIVHPAVRQDFKTWVEKQEGEYVIQEAAILFENGGYKNFDKMILVTAPKKERIARIKLRDHLTEKAILERMQHQWPVKKKKELAQYVIINKNLEDTRNQVRKIHDQILQKS